MITKTVFLSSLDTGSLLLGYMGENNHIRYNIRCDSIFDDYPNCEVTMLVKAPDGTVYPKIVDVDAPSVYWVIDASDTAKDGNGQIQLTFTDNGEVVKTVIAATNVLPSLVGSGEPAPSPVETWQEEANAKLAQVDDALQNLSEENIAAVVDEWLTDNITNPDSPPLDRSLSSSSAAAPADLVGSIGKTVRSKPLNGYLVDVCGTEIKETTYKSVKVTKNQNTFTLDGTSSGTMRAKLSGNIDLQTYLQDSWKSESLNLISGKKYRLSIAMVGGSFTSGTLYITVMDNTGATTVHNIIKPADNIPVNSIVYSEEFTASNTNQACIYIYYASGATFSNYTFQLDFISFEDIRNDLGINFDVNLCREETNNLLSLSKNGFDSLKGYGASVEVLNSNEFRFSITKAAGVTARIPLASNISDELFDFDILRSNLPAGTYTLFYAVENPASNSNIRFRHRESASENGSNIESGIPFTLESATEIYITLTSGASAAVYSNTVIKFSVYAGEVTDSRYVPRITANDAKARAMLEELAFANSDAINETARILINKTREPGDILFTVGADYHFHNSQEEREGLWQYVAFCRSIAIDNMIELGDNVRGYGDDTPDKTRNDMATLNNTLKNALHPLLYVIGNHDDASGYVKAHSEDANDFISDNELRNYYILNCDTNIVKTDYLYYYLDNADYKIRTIVLNSSDIPKENDSTTGKAKYYAQNDYAFRNTQINWLKDVLLSVPEGYSVVVLVHIPITREYTNFSAVKGLIMACHAGTTYSSSGSTTDFEYSVSADFSSHSRKVLCVLCGHTHDPKIEDLGTGAEYTGSSITATGIPQIIQDNGETYQCAYIINENKITQISISDAEKIEIDISGI